MSPSIIVAGSTGHLGGHITEALLAKRASFNRISLLIRRKTPQTDAWEQAGLSIILFGGAGDDLTSKLDGHDILVNCLPSTADDVRQAIAKSLPSTSIKLYFPSEFGVDHDTHDFDHPEWSKKKAHLQLVRGGIKAKDRSDIKVCRVYAGLFLEDSIGPWFGFDTKQRVYQAVGSADQRTSYTSLGDVGKAVAALAMKLDWQDLPDQIHLSGDTVSTREIANIMAAVSGQDIRVAEVDLPSFKASTLEEPGKDPGKCLRFLMGEGKIQHEQGKMGNEDEVVNSGEKAWKWKRMEDLAKETEGKPWGDWSL